MSSKTFGDKLVERIGDDFQAPDLKQIVATLSGPQVVTELEIERHIEYPEEGVELTVDNCNKLIGIHLFSEGLDGKHGYHRGGPFNVTFYDRHDDVIKKCERQPDKSGAETVWRGKCVPPWDLYYLAKASVHFQYSRENGRVELITIMWGGAFGSEDANSQ